MTSDSTHSDVVHFAQRRCDGVAEIEADPVGPVPNLMAKEANANSITSHTRRGTDLPDPPCEWGRDGA